MSNKPDTTTASGGLSKLKAHRDANSKECEFRLPKTGVMVKYPGFVKHGDLARCMRMAKGDAIKAQTMFVCKYAKFEGDTLTLADFEAFVPMSDAIALFAEIFDDGEEDETGE